MPGLEFPRDIILPPKTTELDRLSACSEESHRIGEFLDWLTETYPETPIYDLKPDELLHEYFKIDKEKVEQERRELMAHLRLTTARTEIRKELLLNGD